MVNDDTWPRLLDDVVNGLPEHEQKLIRQHEDEMIAASSLQLDDIIQNCHIKPQYAKTYRVLRRDKRKMIDKGRQCLSQPNAEFSDAYGMALLRSTDAILDYKLRLMAANFSARWGEPIESWAGKEGSAIDRSGCCIVFLAVGSATLAGLVKVICLLV